MKFSPVLLFFLVLCALNVISAANVDTRAYEYEINELKKEINYMEDEVLEMEENLYEDNIAKKINSSKGKMNSLIESINENGSIDNNPMSRPLTEDEWVEANEYLKAHPLETSLVDWEEENADKKFLNVDFAFIASISYTSVVVSIQDPEGTCGGKFRWRALFKVTEASQMRGGCYIDKNKLARFWNSEEVAMTTVEFLGGLFFIDFFEGGEKFLCHGGYDGVPVGIFNGTGYFERLSGKDFCN